MNHSLRYNGTFATRKHLRSTLMIPIFPVTGFLPNEGESFSPMLQRGGINSSVIGYGLGIAVSDINLDGYPDIYIGNDFHENDYLYINQNNGTFKEELTEHIHAHQPVFNGR